jgi:hypothetical protein
VSCINPLWRVLLWLDYEWFETVLDYKIKWDKVLAYRERTGATGPEPVPHPDDIVLDRAAGTVWIAGLMSGEKQVMLREFVQRADEQGRDLLALLKEERDRVPMPTDKPVG